jgi:predicted PurR-regulated permease PerM
MVQPFELRVPFATLIRIALAFLLILCIVKLWPVILAIVFAILLAVMFDPFVGWLERHRVRRGAGIALVAFLLFAFLVVVLAVFAPMVSRQVAELGKQLPQIEQRMTVSFPWLAPILSSLHAGAKPVGGPQIRTWLAKGFVAGMYALEGVAGVVFVFVVAIYLLVEGRRAFAWLVTFAKPRTRDRLVRTAEETSYVVQAYVRGAIFAATLCAIYVFVVLTALHVPGALMLTVLAFFCDFIPVVGTIVQILPAAALAMTVSPSRALLAAAAYLFYHVLENYVIIPRVYGKQLRLSTLTVLLAFAVGATLQGAAGAILAMPIAAAWPIIERIWLRESLPDDTIPVHDRLESEDGAVSDEATREIVDEGKGEGAKGEGPKGEGAKGRRAKGEG